MKTSDMSETKFNSLENALELLEEYNLTNLSRPNGYETICCVLNSTETVSPRDIERILTVCTHDLQEDMKYTVEALKVISSVIKQTKPEVITQQPDLVPSALAILNLLRSIATNNMKGLRTLCMDTLLNYPNETLIEVASSHTGSFLDLYSEASSVAESTSVLLLNFLHKLLKIIPPDKRNLFVRKGLDQWFNFVLPKSFYFVSLCQENSLKALEVLELLTNELVDIDYSENVTWQKVIMPCIYTPQRFPDVMRKLLEAGAPTWHRLWIVLVKLLKSQITMNKHKNGSPINSLLPVVEMAFKMDVTNRCRAFQCWDVLIDNFSTETVEALVQKRIKLLLIPLKSNNAKVEETVVAKFNTWFHLLTKFELQLEKLKDGILLLFIQFCFGKCVDSPKNIFVPGLISVNVRKMCVQKFIEIFGHVDCDICVTSPRLLRKLINAQLLEDHWKDYKYALKTATKICSETSLIHQVVHLWKSFFSTIAELPDSNVRKQFFSDMLMLLEKLLQEGQNDKQCIDIVFNVLTESIFDGEYFKTVLKTWDTIDIEDGPIHKVLSVLLQVFQQHDYVLHNRFDVDESIKKLKQITNCMIDTSICSTNQMSQWLLLYMSANDNTIILWTALTESLNESSHDLTDGNLYLVLLWPLENLKKLKFIPKKCVSVWYAMLNVVFPKLNKILIEEFSRTLLNNSDYESPSTYFILYASLGFVKHCVAKGGVNFDKEIELFKDVLNKIANYSEIEYMFPALVDTIVLLMKETSGSQDIKVAEHSVSLTNTTLRLFLQALKDNTYELQKDHVTAVECLLNSIKTLIASKSHSDLKLSILVVLIEYSDTISKLQPSLKLEVLSIMKTYLQSIAATNLLYQNLKSTVENIENGASADKTTEKTAFNTPNVNIIKKKRKETSIVDTVIENGEEYVVVKSNWKFNPKKLTDAQKEKLTKKRDDIPALYQDLSQSQDEFKLQNWKTDSQDTSTTSKSTSDSGDATSILKNVPSTCVVPKIMENILTEKVTSSTDAKNNTTDDMVSVKIRSSPAVKDKSNRMTLKDRVFKNLKVLAESVSVKDKSTEFNKKESSDVIKVPLEVSVKIVSVEEKSTDLSQKIINDVTTPVTKEKQIINAMNSAPSKISLERPARVKRKPKKFDDSELFASKKRRYSHSDSNSDGDRSLKSKRATCTKDNTTAKDDTNSKKNLTAEVYANGEDDAATGDDLNNKDNINKLDSKIGSSDTGLIVQVDSENQNINIIDKNMDENNTVQSNPNSHSECTIGNSNTTNCTVDELSIINQEIRSSEKTVQECNDKSSSCNETVKDVVLDVKLLTVISDNKLKSSEDLIQNSKEKPSTKKSKKSKIEKELAIDMVEGHPFLQSQSEKRVRRKLIADLNPSSTRRKTLIEKLNKSKSIMKGIPKVDKKTKDLKSDSYETDKNIVDDEANKKRSDSLDLPSSEDFSSSEDVIESSQDSSITTISVKSTKSIKKQSTTSNAIVKEPEKTIKGVSETQKVLKCDIERNNTLEESKEDIELPKNKTAEQEVCLDLTEDMDTEPIEVFDTPSNEVAIVEDKKEVICLNSDDTGSQLDTQNTANADTELLNTVEFEKSIDGNFEIPKVSVDICNIEKNRDHAVAPITEQPVEKISEPENNSVRVEDETNETGDDNQRKREFLNNTSEISPIKTLSPIRNSRSPTPEANTDYVVIKLSSPVQINGEPYEKSDSPEIFTDDKVLHENQDKSPPREDSNMVTNNSSPSLSLKRSRPQVRPLGRGAQMLGLCVPDHLQTITNTEKYNMDPEEFKKCPTPSSSVARRNLRILYSSSNDSNESEQNENSDNFLKFKRSLPTSTCSPAGPILKRKLADIADDSTTSPASKRKRVSFHDPPVSTTIAVQKYIEPGGIRSPQCSASKRLERASRPHANMKSPKRLDTAFKLDTVLTKAIESFNESDNNLTADSEMSSLDQTPAVEVIKTSELNDTDPICPDLINCLDPIENIAAELSSPAMQSLLVKELEGKVVTIADLAKMTELEVNRLCIKAPKIKVVKKVLADYIVKKAAVDPVSEVDKLKEKELEELPQTLAMDVEVQTTMLAVNDSVAQTVKLETRLTETQTDALSLASSSAQTDESGYKSTADVVSSCLRERADFVEQLTDQLEDTSKQKIAESLPFNDLVDLLMDKTNADNSKQILNRVLEQQCERNPKKELSYLRDYLSSKYETKELLMFCSRLLQKLHDKS